MAAGSLEPFSRDQGAANEQTLRVVIANDSPAAFSSMAALGKLTSANFNSTADQAIAIAARRYVIRKILVTNASLSLDTAVGGLYDATSKGGNAVVAATQVYSALTSSTKFVDLTLAAPATGSIQTVANIYFSLTTPQGAAATGDIYIFGDVL